MAVFTAEEATSLPLDRRLFVGDDVASLGVAFTAMPPEKVCVKKLAPGSWAEKLELCVGDEIISINDFSCAVLTEDLFKVELGERPLSLVIRSKQVVRGDMQPGHQMVVFEADVFVEGAIGLAFTSMPPGKLLAKKIQPGSWAETAGFEVGDDIVLLNGSRPAELTPDTFRTKLQERPLTIVALRAPIGSKTATPAPGKVADDEDAATTAGGMSPSRLDFNSTAGLGSTAGHASAGGLSAGAGIGSELTLKFPVSPQASVGARLAQAASPVSPGSQNEASVKIQAAIRAHRVRKVISTVRTASQALVLEGFDRGVVNGRYIKNEKWASVINNHETYTHESGMLLLYYCKEYWDWRVTNTMQNAKRNLGLVRSTRGVVLERSTIGKPWQEYEKCSCTWVRRPWAGISALEVQGHLRFNITLVGDEVLPLVHGVDFAFKRAIAACAGPPVHPSWIELCFASDETTGTPAAEAVAAAASSGAPVTSIVVKARIVPPTSAIGHIRYLVEGLSDLDVEMALEEEIAHRDVHEFLSVDSVIVGRGDETVMRFDAITEAEEVASRKMHRLGGASIPFGTAPGASRSDLNPLVASGGAWPSAAASSRRSSNGGLFTRKNSLEGSGVGGSAAKGRSKSWQPPKRRLGALHDFKEWLLTRYASYANAWRRHMDPRHKGWITFSEFCDFARRATFRGNVRDAFAELDRGHIGRITLEELDLQTSGTLKRLHGRMVDRFGSVQASVSYIGVAGRRRLHREEFAAALLVHRLASSAVEADECFHLLSNSESSWALARHRRFKSHAVVSKAEIEWLASISRWLPQGLDSRAPPGEMDPKDVVGEASVVDDTSTLTPDIAGFEDTSMGGSDDGGGGQGPHYEGGVYLRLWSDTRAWHEKQEHRCAASEKPKWRKPASAPRETVDRLHNESFRRLAMRQEAEDALTKDIKEKSAGGSKGKSSDSTVARRLVTPRPDFSDRHGEHIEPQMTPPPGAPSEKGMEASERNYAWTQLRDEKRKALLLKHKMHRVEEEREILEAGRKGKSDRDDMDEDEFIERFYNRLVQLKQGKRALLLQKKARADADEAQGFRDAQVHAGKAFNPECYLRLHTDHARIQAKLEAKREAQAIEEEAWLQEHSVHKHGHGQTGEFGFSLDAFGDQWIDVSDSWNTGHQGYAFYPESSPWEPQAEPGGTWDQRMWQQYQQQTQLSQYYESLPHPDKDETIDPKKAAYRRSRSLDGGLAERSTPHFGDQPGLMMKVTTGSSAPTPRGKRSVQLEVEIKNSISERNWGRNRLGLSRGPHF